MNAVAMALLFLSASLCPGSRAGVAACLGAGFAGACVVLSISPLPRERSREPLACGVILLLASALILFLHLEFRLIFVFQALCLLGALAVRTALKFSQVNKLFSPAGVWTEVEEYAKLFYMVVALFVCTLSCALYDCAPFVSLAPAAGAAGLMYVRVWTGKTMLLSREKENRIKDLMRITLRSSLTSDNEQELSRLKKLYDRCVEQVVGNQKFLDPNLSLAELSMCLYCNRQHLSRCVNVFSGRNFKQFLNFHRVNYSVDLMRRDRRLKVAELAIMSGFNNTVSYTMAFKSFMGTTPTEYLRQLPSSLREEER